MIFLGQCGNTTIRNKLRTDVCAGSCMYRKRFIHITWRHGGHVRLGCIIDFVWFFWSCLNWPNTTDPTIYTSNNMINTIVPSITYKLSPSPHIRMWKKYFTYTINFRIISHTCMCKWHLIWSENAYTTTATRSSDFFTLRGADFSVDCSPRR